MRCVFSSSTPVTEARNLTSSAFDLTVSAAGDVNGDGYGDVVMPPFSRATFTGAFPNLDALETCKVVRFGRDG